MTVATHIRTATMADAPAIARLMTAFNRAVGAMGVGWGRDTSSDVADVSPAQAERRLTAMAATETVYLAEVDGLPVGIAALRVVPHLDQDVPYAELTQIYVTPEHRRNGVAAALIGHVEAQARSAGATSVYLLTGHDNAAAQAFYQAQGFQPDYVGFDKFLGAANLPLPLGEGRGEGR
jgi:ribosomal protein S18 acetylase RimI-like enzyme